MVERLLGCYGQYRHRRVQAGELPQLEIGPWFDGRGFRQRQAAIEIDEGYELELESTSARCWSEVLGAESARGGVHYFFAASVEGLLAQGLDRLEAAIWADATEPRRLLIGDLDLRRSGPGSTSPGEQSQPAAAPACPAIRAVLADIERVRGDRAEQVSWDYQWVQRLTPVQLQLDGEPGGSRLEELARRRVRPALPAVHLRPRAAGSETPPASGEPAGVPGRPGHRAGPGPRDAADRGPVTGAAADGFAGLVDWCYRLRDEGTTRDWAPERLRFTQVRIAQVLEPVPRPARW